MRKRKLPQLPDELQFIAEGAAKLVKDYYDIEADSLKTAEKRKFNTELVKQFRGELNKLVPSSKMKSPPRFWTNALSKDIEQYPLIRYALRWIYEESKTNINVSYHQGLAEQFSPENLKPENEKNAICWLFVVIDSDYRKEMLDQINEWIQQDIEQNPVLGAKLRKYNNAKTAKRIITAAARAGFWKYHKKLPPKSLYKGAGLYLVGYRVPQLGIGAGLYRFCRFGILDRPPKFLSKMSCI